MTSNIFADIDKPNKNKNFLKFNAPFLFFSVFHSNTHLFYPLHRNTWKNYHLFALMIKQLLCYLMTFISLSSSSQYFVSCHVCVIWDETLQFLFFFIHHLLCTTVCLILRVLKGQFDQIGLCYILTLKISIFFLFILCVGVK